MFRIPFQRVVIKAHTSYSGRTFTSLTGTSLRGGVCSSTNYLSGGNKYFLSTTSDDDVEGTYNKVAFIGAGKMAQAMIKPLIDTKIQPEDKIAVYDVSTTITNQVVATFPKIQVAESIEELVTDADLVVCAVKPQNVNETFYNQFPVEKLQKGNAKMISILAGIPMKQLMPMGFPKIVRSMPNTPATIGEGITVWSCTENLTTEEREDVKTVLCTFGKTIYVDDEKFVDMSTSISGSGPAYIFMLMEAMVDAGVHMGFNRDTATTLVHHTLLGSTLYAMETGEHPAILRNMVTSPAGTTASAVYELENGKFRVVIKDAIWACYRRSLEMGGKSSDVGPGRVQPETMDVVHHHIVETPAGEITDEVKSRIAEDFSKNMPK